MNNKKKKSWYERNLSSNTPAGRIARRITDSVGAKGIRQAAGDYAGGRKVNKKELAKGVGNLAMTVGTGSAGVAGSMLKRKAGKTVGKQVMKKTTAKKAASMAKKKPAKGYGKIGSVKIKGQKKRMKVYRRGTNPSTISRMDNYAKKTRKRRK